MYDTIRKDPRALKENEKICLICKKFFVRRGDKKHTAKYCSMKCKGISLRGTKTKKKKFLFIEKQCEVCEKKFHSWKNQKAKFCSRKCYFDSNHELLRGVNHWNWKGGVSPLNQFERKSKKYSRWRRKVFKRDKHTCQKCGQVGGRLEAHHIKSWAENPKLRFIIKNGLTLCKNCHEKTDNYKRIRK